MAVTRRDVVCLSIGAMLEAACYVTGRLLGWSAGRASAARWL